MVAGAVWVPCCSFCAQALNQPLSKHGAEAVNKWDLIHEDDQAEYRETILNRPGSRASAGMWNLSRDYNIL